MVRTIPGDNTFEIKNIEDINQRFEASHEGNVSISNWYYDQFSSV